MIAAWIGPPATTCRCRRPSSPAILNGLCCLPCRRGSGHTAACELRVQAELDGIPLLYRSAGAGAIQCDRHVPRPRGAEHVYADRLSLEERRAEVARAVELYGEGASACGACRGIARLNAR